MIVFIKCIVKIKDFQLFLISFITEFLCMCGWALVTTATFSGFYSNLKKFKFDNFGDERSDVEKSCKLKKNVNPLILFHSISEEE